MKKKTYVSIMLTVFLVTMLFNGIPMPAKAWDGTIKIGAIGPMPWIQGQGIEEGTKLAAKQINNNASKPGIEIGGKNYKVEIVSADTLRGMPDPTGTTGAAAASELVSKDVDFVVGGFRTEATYGIRETLMDYQKIYFIAGAATNELVYEPTKTDNIYDNYARYKYTFRVTPTNGTQLFYAILGYCLYYLVPRIAKMYLLAHVPIAVVSEALTWADSIHNSLCAYLPYFTGGVAQIVYTARVSPTTTDMTAEITGVKNSGARICIEVISGPSGRTFAKQFDDLNVGATLFGIDVPGQEIPLHWTATGGKCEYEMFLVTTGQETPQTGRTRAFWDAYEAEYGHAPIYTSYGAYDAVLGIERTLEANAADWATTTSDMMVPWFEATNLDGTGLTWDYGLGAMVANTGTVSKFKYTGPSGTHHDVYSKGGDNMGPTWPFGWARSHIGQWQYSAADGTGRLEIVFPLDRTYSAKTKIPTRAYTLAETDLVPDVARTINLADMGVIATTWLSHPGSANWITSGSFLGLLADMDNDKIITISDASVVAADYGKYAGP